MDTNLALKIRRKFWKTAFGEISWIKRNGDFRAQERFGLIGRPNYLYGMLRAADCAKYFGHRRVTAIEFGVASGDGLINMTKLAPLITEETGVEFRIVGFDTGTGLPQIQGYKDHPEIWNPGDFVMEDRNSLVERLQDRAEIFWGDIGQTVGPFTDSIDPRAPIGFISIDVDIFSATKSALRCLTSTPEKYAPAISMYFDDVSFYFASEWTGELAAIHEFNSENDCRKIGRDMSLPGHRPVKAEGWYSSMYVCHILDHEARANSVPRSELTVKEHAEFMKSRFLF